MRAINSLVNLVKTVSWPQLLAFPQRKGFPELRELRSKETWLIWARTFGTYEVFLLKIHHYSVVLGAWKSIS